MDPPKYSTVSIKLKSIDPCVCFSRNWLHTRQTISPEFLEQSWLENNLNLNFSSSWLNQHNFPSCSTVHCTLNKFSKFFKRWIYWFQFFLFCEAVHLILFFCLILFFINLLFYVPKTGGRWEGGMPKFKNLKSDCLINFTDLSNVSGTKLQDNLRECFLNQLGENSKKI